MNDPFSEIRFVSKAELAERFGISRETLRLKLKEVKGLNTGRRQLLYPWEVRLVYVYFNSEK
jgi:Zn-dependent peptidase ImmA (M78 family)